MPTKFRDKVLRKAVLKLSFIICCFCALSTLPRRELDRGESNKRWFNIPSIDNSSLCVWTLTDPSVNICPFPAEEDIYVSAGLLEKGVWEPDVLAIFQQALGNHPKAIVIDIGAHVGYYTLVSAKMGHSVVAIDPYSRSLSRLWQAAKLNSLSDQIKVVNAGASSDKLSYQMHLKKGNIGGTYLRESGDSLSVPVETVALRDLIFEKDNAEVIIKADAEGFECKALDHSIFKKVYVPYIFMEWGMMFRGRYISANPCRHEDLQDLVNFLSDNYEVYVSRNCRKLGPDWSEWRVDDIFWVHRNAARLNCSESA